MARQDTPAHAAERAIGSDSYTRSVDTRVASWKCRSTALDRDGTTRVIRRYPRWSCCLATFNLAPECAETTFLVEAVVLIAVAVFGVGSWWLVGQAGRSGRPTSNAPSGGPLQDVVSLGRRRPVLGTALAALLGLFVGASEAWRFSDGETETLVLAGASAVVAGGFLGWKVSRSRRRVPGHASGSSPEATSVHSDA